MYSSIPSCLECNEHLVIYSLLYCRAQKFIGGKLSQISHQKRLARKSLMNSCLVAFFIEHTINSFGYQYEARNNYSHEHERGRITYQW